MNKVQAIERELSAYRNSYSGNLPCVSESNGRVCYTTRRNGEQVGQGNAEDAVGTVTDPSFIFQFNLSQFEINPVHITANAIEHL